MNMDELRDKEYAFCKAEEDAFYENQSDANRIAALCKRDEFNRMMLRQQQAEIESMKEQIKEKDVCLKILMQRLDDGN